MITHSLNFWCLLLLDHFTSLSIEAEEIFRSKEKLLNTTRWPEEPRPYSPTLSLLPFSSPSQPSSKCQRAEEEFQTIKELELERLSALESKESYTYSMEFKRSFNVLDFIKEKESIAELEARKEDHAHLLQISEQNLIEHAARRIDTFFYTLVAYYKTNIFPIQSDTILQYGQGRNTQENRRKVLTAGCHSYFFPQLMGESITYEENLEADLTKKPLLRRRSILCGTHFLDAANSVVELPVAVNNIDSNLEGKKKNPSITRQKALDILHRVARGAINPAEGITEYLVAMEEILTHFQTDTARSSYLKKECKTAPTAIKPDLLRLTKQGSLNDKLAPNGQASPEYVNLLLRLTDTEIAECQTPARKSEIYEKQFFKMQREILNSTAAHIASPKSLEEYIKTADAYFNQQEYVLALEYYEYAWLYNIGDPLILQKIAKAQIALGKHADACQSYRRALESTSLSSKDRAMLLTGKNSALKILLSQAKNYFNQKEYNLARIAYECAFYYVPKAKKPEILFSKGKAWHKLDNIDEARIASEQALKLDPENRIYKNFLFYMHYCAANYFYSNKNHPDALGWCEAALSRFLEENIYNEPKAWVLFLKTKILYAAKQYDQALVTFQAAWALDHISAKLRTCLSKMPADLVSRVDNLTLSSHSSSSVLATSQSTIVPAVEGNVPNSTASPPISTVPSAFFNQPNVAIGATPQEEVEVEAGGVKNVSPPMPGSSPTAL